MIIKCEKCGFENIDHSLFCSQCGQSLASDPETAQLQARREQLQAQFESELKASKHTALDDFQQRATNWIRYQLIAFTTATSVVIAFLGYIGFNGFNVLESTDEIKATIANGQLDIKNTSESVQAELETKLKSVQDEFEKKSNAVQHEFEKKSNAVQDSLSSLKEQLRSIEETRSKIETLLSDIKTQKSELSKIEKSLRNRFKEQQKDLDKQIAAIEKIASSRYRILIHHKDAKNEKYRVKLDQLRKKLYAKGYVVSSEDLFNVTVDQQEIIYYSDTLEMEDRANTIKNIISEQLGIASDSGEIVVRLESAGSNDPYQIVIKLCATGVANLNSSNTNICQEYLN